MPTLFLAIDAQRARDGAGRFVAATNKVTGSAAKASTAVTGLDARLKTMGATATAVRGRMLGLFGTLAGFVAVRSAVRTISTFEETLLTLQGVAVKTNLSLAEQARQFNDLEDAARTAGATTRFSATEAAEGLLFLSRAGFDADQAIEALPSTLNLAVAGVLGLGEAADIASNTVKQFGLTTADTERVVDGLIRTSNNANTDVRQLAEALKLAGPIAKQAGISFEDTAVAVGVLSDAGVQASLAGTSLRGLLLALSAPTSKAEKAFRKLKLSAEELNPATDSLTNIFAKLDKGLQSIAQEDRLGVLDAIFGRRQAAGAGIAADSVERLGSAFNRAGRSGAELAKLQDSGLTGSFKALVSAIQEGFLVLGRDKGFGKALQDVVDTATDTVRVLIGMEEAVKGNIGTAKNLAAAVQGLAAGFIALQVLKPILFFAGLAKAVLQAGGALKALRVLLATNPLGLIVLGVSAAVAAIARFKDEVFTIGESTASASDFARAAFEVLGQRVQLVGRAIQIIFKDSLDFVRDGFDTAFGAIFSAVERFIGDFDTNWGALFDDSVGVVRSFGNTTIQVLVGVGSALISLVSKFDDFIIAFNAFDPTRPFASLKDVKNQIAFVGSEIAFELQRDFREAFDKDFIGGIGAAFGDALTIAKTELEEQAGIELPPISELFDPGEIANQIGARAEELRLAREALAKEAESKAAGVDTSGAGAFDLPTLPDSDGFDKAGKDADALTKKLERQREVVQATADAIANDFGTAFGDVVFKTKDVDEALEGLFKNVTRQLFDLLVTRQLTQALAGGIGAGLDPLAGGISVGGGSQSAKGNVFKGGTKRLLAKGGVFTRATALPAPGGGQNILAEAGREEGAFPLTRDSKGDLAVSAVGLGGGGDMTVIQNITTPDLDGFRRSRRQLSRDARRDLERRS